VSLSRTSGSGLVDRNEYDNGSFPFDDSEWTRPTGWDSNGVVGGKMLVESTGNHPPNWMTRDMTARSEMMVYSRVDLNNNIQFGAGVLVSNITAGSQDGIEAGMAHGFSGGRFLTRWTAGAVVSIDFTGSGINITPSASRVTVWANANDAAMYDHQNAAIESGTYNPPVSSKTGEPGIFADFSATGQSFDVEKFFVFAGRYVVVTGLTSGSGQKAKIRKSDGTVLASATEVSGTATIDCLAIEEWWNVHNLAITTSADALIEQNVGDVWPGETWSFTAPLALTGTLDAVSAMSATALTFSIALAGSLAAVSTMSATGLTINSAPATPTIDGTVTGPRSISVESSDYSHPDSVPIGAVIWQLATNAGFTTGVQTVEIPYADPADAPDPLTYGWGDLLPATTYWLRVKHEDENGFESLYSSAISRTTEAEIPPTTPSIVTASPGDTTVSLVGSAYADPEGRAHVSSDWQIDVAAGTFASPVNESLSDSTGPTTEIFAGLLPGTAYKARVRYRADDGAVSAWSAAKSFTTLSVPTNRPAQPIVSIVMVTQTSVQVTSSAYSDPTGSPHAQSRWFITNWPGGGTFGAAYKVADVISAADLTAWLRTGLVAGVNYNIAVRYKAADGDWSDWSPWVPFTTTAAPLNGQLLQIQQPRQGAVVRGTAVSLVWTPASVGGNTFEVEYSPDNGTPASWIPLASGIASSPLIWNVSGLTDGVYVFRVRAVAGSEVSDWQYRIIYIDNQSLLFSGTYLFNTNAEEPMSLGDFTPIWNEDNITWSEAGGGIRYTSEAFVLEESGLAYTPAFEPRQVDVIGEVLIGSLGGSFPWNWFPEQAYAGLGVFSDGPFIPGRNPTNGVAAMIFAVPINAYGDCELRGSGDGFLQIALWENGKQVLTEIIDIGRVHVVNQFSGCTKVPRYGIRLRLTTVAEGLPSGKRRMRVQVSVWGRGIDVPTDGWHYQGTVETALDCGFAAFTARNANTTNGPYRSFTNLTVIPYEYGGCSAPPMFSDPIDVETCPPRVQDFTIFDVDDVTPMFGSVDDYGEILDPSFSTDPNHARPWLKMLGLGPDHEVDPIAATSNIGSVSVEVIDKRLDACDPKTGFLTFYGAEATGFSAYIGRRALFRERLSDGTYQVIANGPITEVVLLDTKVTYGFRVASMRERERDVALFDTQHETMSAFPYGPVEGYGLLPNGEQLLPPAGIASGRLVGRTGPSAGIIYAFISNDDGGQWAVHEQLPTLGIPQPIYGEFGDFQGYAYTRYIVRWRYVGDTEWTYLYDMPTVGSDAALEGDAFSIQPWGNQLNVMEKWGQRFYQGSLMLIRVSAFEENADLLPDPGEEIEFQVLPNTQPSDAFPFYFDGSFGTLLRRIYDGDFSPQDPGILYEASCMDLFEAQGGRALLVKRETENDLANWVQENIYQARGWLPSLTDDGLICPIDASLPDATDALPVLDSSNTVSAEFSQDGSRATPVVIYRFIRESLSYVLEDPYQLGIISTEFEIQRQSPNQEISAKSLVIAPETVRTLGPLSVVDQLENSDDSAAQLALQRIDDLISRYAFGPQIVPVRVRDNATTRQLTVGSWCILDLDWIPNLNTFSRGGEQLALVIRRQKDVGLAWNLTLILAGPGRSGLGQPDVGEPTENDQQQVCIFVTVPEEYEYAGGGIIEPGEGGGGGEGGEGSSVEPIWELDPSEFASTAAFLAASDVIIPADTQMDGPGTAGGIATIAINSSPPAGAPRSKSLDYTYNHGNNGCTTITIGVSSIRLPPMQEMWVQYYIRWSPNFRTTEASCYPNDHKLIFYDTVSDESGRFADYVGAGTGPNHELGTERSRDPDLGPGFQGGRAMNLNTSPVVYPYPNLWDGNWHIVRRHIRMSTTTTSDDGLMETWVDGRKLDFESGFNTCASAADGNGIDRLNGISFCHNKDDGPANVTMVLSWGLVQLWDQNPGWDS
jgi:hypothetical protein